MLSIRLLCGQSLPDNLLVIAMYFRHVDTSTVVYLFALTVADTVSHCLLNYLDHREKVHTKVHILFWFGHASVLFLVLLVAFVSMERLLSARVHIFHPECTTDNECATLVVGSVVTVAGCATALAILTLLHGTMPVSTAVPHVIYCMQPPVQGSLLRLDSIYSIEKRKSCSISDRGFTHEWMT